MLEKDYFTLEKPPKVSKPVKSPEEQVEIYRKILDLDLTSEK